MACRLWARMKRSKREFELTVKVVVIVVVGEKSDVEVSNTVVVSIARARR
jgi:hypothetical protein